MPRKFTRVNRKPNRTRKLQKGGSDTYLFKNAYVISIDKNTMRYKNIETKARVVGLSIQHWPATVIKPENSIRKSLPLRGVGISHFTDRSNTYFNLGGIGCFLSHRNLLEHLANSNSLGTLILEDDAEISPLLFNKLKVIEQELPNDWDIVFLDKWGGKSETRVSKHIVKIKQSLDPYVCFGTYSYIVKNSSIKSKILPILKYMTNHIDLQYTAYADILNEYIAYGVIPVNKEHNTISTITNFDTKKYNLYPPISITNYIKHAVFINLDKRTDRRRHIESEFKMFSPNLTRIRGYLDEEYPYLGCMKGHVAAIEFAQKSNFENVLILEDDAKWSNIDKAYPIFEMLCKRPYDVIMLGGTYSYYDKNTYKVKQSQGGASYLINKSYYPTILKKAHEVLSNFVPGITKDEDITPDIALFKPLQKSDNWFIVAPSLITQMKSHSNILKKTVDYTNAYN
uniref:Glycosyl transferase family 25 domain-containing protein n=1 Tax=viral metagenome TaxID=1070528 RepID=A0A6C0DHS5_9ZZZZ